MVESKSTVKSFVISKKVVLEAWEDVKSNRGAAGVDGENDRGFREGPFGEPLPDLECVQRMSRESEL